MADNEETSQTEAAADAEAPKGRGKLPLIALAAVGLAVGAGTGALVLGPMISKKLGKAPVAADSLAHEEPKEEEASATPSVHLISDLVLNPAGTGGARFLLLSVAIECSDAAMLTRMQARDAELRDIVLTSLGNKTVEELTEVAGRDRIKTEIQRAIAERFGKKSVKRLYFPQFVVQ